MLTSESVFAVPVLDRWLIHAPLHRVTALVNRAALDDPALDSSGLGRELAGPGTAPAPRQGPIDPGMLGLIPTRACGLSCVYCGFGAARDAARMDPQLACAAVDWMAAHVVRSGRRTLNVHFFGGEPMAARDLVECTVERTRVRAAEKGLQPNLGISTNGVYNDRAASFLGSAFNSVVLSFDGFAPVQDRHRPIAPARGTFDRVCRTACILSRSPALLSLRICIADDNVGELPETTEWFCTEFRPSSIVFETLQPTPESEKAGLRPPDPYLFAGRVWKAGRAALGFGVEPVYAAAAADAPRITLCPMGDDALIVNPGGIVSACYLRERDWRVRGLDLKIGRLHDDGTLDIDPAAVDFVRSLAADRPRCKACFCRWSCAGGCHVNHSFPGCSLSYDDFCVQTRLITACSLLAGLEQAASADRLVSDRAAMRHLARQTDDRVVSHIAGL